MTAATACRTCGTEPLDNARFCHGCGSPLTESSTHAEYKQVTVLFADVVHSMDIAAAVGAERLREIMADLVDRCGGGGAALRRHGGQVHRRRRSWRCSARRSRWRTTLFAPVLRHWAFKRKRSGSPSRSKSATALSCSCGSD